MKSRESGQIEKQPRSKRAIAALAGTAALATALVGGGVLFRQGISDIVFHKSTSQETMIANALDKSLDAEGTKVICAPSERIQTLNPFQPDEYVGRVRAIGLPYVGAVWLEASRCDILSELKTNSIVHSDLFSNMEGHDQARTEEIIEALLDAGHEGSHAVRDDTNEANAECYSFQVAPKLAEEFGMDPELSPLLRHSMIVQLQDKHAALTDAPQYNFDLNACSSEGPLNLTPGVDAEFPTQP
jgi:hypothetical protein